MTIVSVVIDHDSIVCCLQEVRMSLAMEVMVVHVENIKRAHEKDRLELNEARSAHSTVYMISLPAVSQLIS